MRIDQGLLREDGRQSHKNKNKPYFLFPVNEGDVDAVRRNVVIYTIS